MKKIISFLLVLCIIFGFCACGKNESGKTNLKIVENEKCKKIVETLGAMKIDEVFDDIKNIDLYLEPDYSQKDYTIKTEKNKETGLNETDYYSGDKLVYTVYESDYEEEFANYTKTASGLDAKVTYYTDSGDNKSVCVETDKYRLFANNLDNEDPYGLSFTYVVLFAENTKAPFESSVSYCYENGIASFDNAVYLDENGSYQSYKFGIDPESEEETEITDVLVNGKAPGTSDDIINVLLSDKSYNYAAVQIRYGNKWYNSGDKWYMKSTLAIAVDNKEQAEDFIKKNNLNGAVDDYGSIIVKIDDVVLPISESAFLESGKLPSFITGESDDSFFSKITLDSNGVITKLERSGLLCY